LPKLPTPSVTPDVNKMQTRPMSVLRVCLRIAISSLVLTALSANARHEKGEMTVSIAGSLAHQSNYRQESEISYELVGDEYKEIKTPKDQRYTEWDIMLSLSAGYFVADRLEVGLSGSALTTSYSPTNRSDFEVYDAKIYAKRFFDNRTVLTPYLKVSAGMSWLHTGDYEENDATFGASLGIEVFGTGALPWFMELGSEYTELSGTVSGNEWENRIYLGLTWYLSRLKPRPEASDRSPRDTTKRALSMLPVAVRRDLQQAERRWNNVLKRLDREIEGPLQQPPQD